MNIFIDLDNTLCSTTNSDYENSSPIIERINKVNKLKEEGNYITIWTARGSNSGLDYTELTKNQLNAWNINYDKLVLGKQTTEWNVENQGWITEDTDKMFYKIEDK